MRIPAGFLGLVIFLGLTGCATLNPGAEKVMITTAEPDSSQYEYMGDVIASSDNALGQEKSVESVRVKLRNKAAALGGDIVKIDTNNQNGGEVTMSGRVFRKK